MRVSLILPVIALAHEAFSSRTPLLPYDGNTTSDCAVWANYGIHLDCVDLRNFYNITPEQFHEWNPLVGLDCSNLSSFRSYCIVTWARMNMTKPTMTIDPTTSTSTTSTISLGPSPTAWTDTGCYDDNKGISDLLRRLDLPDTSPLLTIPVCEDTCHRADYSFAGVRNGDECWCGDSNVGKLAPSQADCNTPCKGDKSAMCGETDRINVFQADGNQTSSSATGTTSMAASTSGLDAVVASWPPRLLEVVSVLELRKTSSYGNESILVTWSSEYNLKINLFKRLP